MTFQLPLLLCLITVQISYFKISMYGYGHETRKRKKYIYIDVYVPSISSTILHLIPNFIFEEIVNFPMNCFLLCSYIRLILYGKLLN